MPRLVVCDGFRHLAAVEEISVSDQATGTRGLQDHWKICNRNTGVLSTHPLKHVPPIRHHVTRCYMDDQNDRPLLLLGLSTTGYGWTAVA